jgi:hypothetical protein
MPLEIETRGVPNSDEQCDTVQGLRRFAATALSRNRESNVGMSETFDKKRVKSD